MTVVGGPEAEGGAASSFKVLARRYRPQTFSEVIGQTAVVRTLTNAIEGGRVAQAYLFCGTRGVGKTTMARLVAKALNCHAGPTVTPCNACPPCKEIAASSSIDVLEIDGASHNRVDDVRELQESLSYQPVRDRTRVIIIDEVHMLSRSAFNALLKTLEEPPPHVVFVLATTEMEKIPATILSRCQHFTFRRIRATDLVGHLRSIAARESLGISDHGLSLLARQAAGSLRDALSALDQLVSFCGAQIDDDAIETILGALPPSRVDELLAAVAHRDAAEALRALRSAEDRGDDPGRFMETLLARLRDLSVVAALGPATDLVDGEDAEREALARLSGSLGSEACTRLFQLAARAEPGLRHGRHPRILLELLALTMVQAADLTPLAEIASRLTREAAHAGGGNPAPRGGTVDRRPAAPPTLPARQREAARPRAAASALAGPAEGLVDLGPLRASVESSRPAVAAFLEHAVARLDGGALQVEFRPRHSFFKKTVEMAANLEALQSAARRLYGPATEVRLALVERADATPEPAPSPRPQVSRDPMLEHVQSQPTVQALTDLFGAEIVSAEGVEAEAEAPGVEDEA